MQQQIPDSIKAALDYIEANLKTDITAEELAQMAGYSTFHYYRLFSSVMGSSVSGYILKRRLDHALGEIASGRKAVEVVLEYGFDTYAGFYKAFVKMYGCSPKKYLSIYQDHIPKKPEVANNKMYTEKELRKILENWEIDKSLPIKDIFIMHGAKPSGNDWTVGEEYILRTGSRDMLMKDMKVAKALAKQGFVSTIPVQTIGGHDYLDGQDVFVLFHALKGAPLPKSDRFGENRAQYGEKYGRSIARLHRALKEVQQDVLADELNLYQVVSERWLPDVRKQNLQWNIGLGEDFFANYTETFGKLYNTLPKQLIHRDPHPGNILFEGGAVSGFTNFDLSEKNIRLFDPCYCATGILSETDDANYEKWLDILRGILYGYDGENKLTNEEKKAVFYVICSIELICVAYFESHEAYRPLAESNRKMLSFIAKHKDRIEQIF